jgi:hypothetical protein
MGVRTLTASAALLGVGLWVFVPSAGARSLDAKTGRTPDAAVVYKIVQQGTAAPVGFSRWFALGVTLLVAAVA